LNAVHMHGCFSQVRNSITIPATVPVLLRGNKAEARSRPNPSDSRKSSKSCFAGDCHSLPKHSHDARATHA
jgi:hypothetical protein